jgi:hypothetical protein
MVALSLSSCYLPEVELALRKFARRPLAPLAVGLFAMALRVSVLPLFPVPQPGIHDEFSYLLQSDTFAHGRLANPTHPMWQHFETYHVDQVPTYASMYPPLQGLFLAAGQVVTGSPFAGVVLSMGLMCAVLCWALRGWFSPGWALLGAAIAAMRLATFSYWADSYFGGALSATGGALLFGALPRLIRSSRPRDAFLAALGMAMLVNSRPYEGSVFCLAVSLVALWHVRKLRLRAILPAACLVLVCAGAFMAYFNWRVFGSPTALPYTVNRQTYAITPVFLFQLIGPPKVYRHAEMEEFYMHWEPAIFESARTVRGYLAITRDKLEWVWNFFIGPVLTLPLLAFFWTWKSGRSRILLFLAAMVALANSMVPFFQPHYLAPALVVFYAAVLQGMRVLMRKWPQLVRAIPLICLAMIGLRLAQAVTSRRPLDYPPTTWARNPHTRVNRQPFIDHLLEEGGEHLVIVRYAPSHDVNAEWVYNDADIDGSPIVWARDMGPEKNAELIHYFASRKVWSLYVDRGAQLTPYSK